MKKTLITLAAFAVASVASATTIEDATADNLAPVPGYTTQNSPGAFETGVSNDAFTMMVVLDWDKLVSSTSNGYNDRKSIEVGYDGGNGYLWYVAGITSFAENGYVYAGIGVNRDTKSGTNSGNSAGDGYNLKLDAETYKHESGNLALTLTFNGTSTYTLSALKNDGSLAVKTVTYDATSLGWNYSNFKYDMANSMFSQGVVERITFFDGVVSSADIAEISAQVVPEPATATLSLLALAGLAARRRRK